MSLFVDIKKDFGDFQLNVSFEAEPGVLGILGASGCGKSMTLRCIAGIVTPDEGKICLNGVTLFDSEKRINLPPQQRKVGLLFQNYALFPNMTVEQNVMCGIREERDRKRRRERTREMIRKMRLTGLEKHRPDALSGGQQQRAALARILVGEPRLLMLDEPFSALDSYLRWQVEMELSDILADYGGTTLLVSHSRDEVYRLCDHVCVISEGTSQPVVPVRALFEDPGTLDAALLSGCKNYSRAKRTGPETVYAEDWGVELYCGKPVPEDMKFIGVRSHYVRAEGHINPIGCTVQRVVEDVFGTVVMLRPDGAAEGSEYGLIRVDIAKADWAAMGEPERLTIGLDPGDILLLK